MEKLALELRVVQSTSLYGLAAANIDRSAGLVFSADR